MSHPVQPRGEGDSAEQRPGVAPPSRLTGEFGRNVRTFGYGFAAQACSAVTNFSLVVIGGRLLGPSGLGTLLIGFAAYVLMLGFQRALLTEPLVAGSSAREPEMASSARAALTLALVASVAAAGILAAVGAVVRSSIGHGMLLFAPWLVPALMQDIGRSVVFRDRTGRSTAFSDATWLLAMAATAPFAFASGGEWAVVSCWGVGATSGAAVALYQLRWRPIALADAIGWWKQGAWRLGRWLGAQAILYNLASYTTVLLLAGILGAADYGGFRAVQSVFAPLSLLGPALALPGLPLVSRLHVHAPKRALRLAAEIAGFITAVTAVYVAVLYAIPDALSLFFGQDFGGFRSIIIPVGLWQVLLAPMFGLTLLFKVEQRGGTLLWLGTLYAGAYLALTVTLGAGFGLSGAAWGAAAAGAVSMAGMAFAIQPSLRSNGTTSVDTTMGTSPGPVHDVQTRVTRS